MAEANPIVGFYNGATEAKTGKDAIYGSRLGTGGRTLSGIAAVASIVPGGSEFKAEGSILKNTGNILKEDWFAKVGTEAIHLGENRAVSGLIKDGKVIGIGDPTLGHGELAKKLGIELVNGKLPQGMEGFLAQITGGKVGVVGAGINGAGE